MQIFLFSLSGSQNLSVDTKFVVFHDTCVRHLGTHFSALIFCNILHQKHFKGFTWIEIIPHEASVKFFVLYLLPQFQKTPPEDTAFRKIVQEQTLSLSSILKREQISENGRGCPRPTKTIKTNSWDWYLTTLTTHLSHRSHRWPVNTQHKQLVLRPSFPSSMME